MRMGNTAVCCSAACSTIEIEKKIMITVTCNVASTNILCLEPVPDSSVVMRFRDMSRCEFQF